MGLDRSGFQIWSVILGFWGFAKMSHFLKKSEETLGEKPNQDGNGNGQKAPNNEGNPGQSSNEEEGSFQDEGGAVGFWSHELKSVRWKVIKKWAITSK